MASEMVMTGPSITLLEGSNERVIAAWVVRDGANAERTISSAYVRDTNNVARLVFNPSGSVTLSVVVSPPGATGFTAGTGTATTNVACVATPSGGTAPYTYLWDLVSHTSLSAPPTANSPTTAGTTFTQTGIDPGANEFADWTVTVMDANMNSVTSIIVSSSFTDIS